MSFLRRHKEKAPAGRTINNNNKKAPSSPADMAQQAGLRLESHLILPSTESLPLPSVACPSGHAVEILWAGLPTILHFGVTYMIYVSMFSLHRQMCLSLPNNALLLVSSYWALNLLCTSWLAWSFHSLPHLATYSLFLNTESTEFSSLPTSFCSLANYWANSLDTF